MDHPAKGSITFAHPGIDRITAIKFPDAIKVCISNNIETKAQIFLDKNEALRLALEFLISIQTLEG